MSAKIDGSAASSLMTPLERSPTGALRPQPKHPCPAMNLALERQATLAQSALPSSSGPVLSTQTGSTGGARLVSGCSWSSTTAYSELGIL